MGRRMRRIMKVLTCNSEERSQSGDTHKRGDGRVNWIEMSTCDDAGEPVKNTSKREPRGIAQISKRADDMYERLQVSIDALKEKIERHDEELTQAILSHCVVNYDTDSGKAVLKQRHLDKEELEERAEVIDKAGVDVKSGVPREGTVLEQSAKDEIIMNDQMKSQLDSTGSANINLEPTRNTNEPQALRAMSKEKLVSTVFENLLADRNAKMAIQHAEPKQHRNEATGDEIGDTPIKTSAMKTDAYTTPEHGCIGDPRHFARKGNPEVLIATEDGFVFGANAHIYDVFSRNNNHPANGDNSDTDDSPVKIHFNERSASLHTQLSSSSAGSSVTRNDRGYYLFPIGSFSTASTASAMSKWKDVASVIPSGVRNHKNVDLKKCIRYEKQLTTISQGVPTSSYVKARVYAVKKVKPPVVCMEALLALNETARIFQETHAKFVCVNLMMALRFLHEHDIAHGSLCPQKIILNDKGYPCLTGFDTAEVIHDRPTRPRGRIDVEYSSSEQIYQDCISETTDTYSLGVLTYHMIYGQPPHRGRTQADTRRNALNKDFVPAFKPEHISKEGKKLIMKCLRKYEDRRFNILHTKAGLFESVSWFSGLNEEKLYKQSVPSPLLAFVSKGPTGTGSI